MAPDAPPTPPAAGGHHGARPGGTGLFAAPRVLGALEGATGAPRPKIIELSDLHRRFGRQAVLRGVNLAVTEGTTVTILGVSGSGKSTLLKHIVGLLKPDSGVVLVDGVAVTSCSRRELEALRSRIGYVFQGAALLANLTVEENVGLPLVESAAPWKT